MTQPDMAFLSQLSSWTPQALLEADLGRLAAHYYGPYLRTGMLASSSLILGGRSGLLALALAQANPHHRFHVIERDRRLRTAIRDSARRLGRNNLLLGTDLDSGFSDIHSSGLGLVCLHQEDFSPDLLSRLRQDFRVDYLIGEFMESQANALWVYRQSRELARYFHWQNLSTGLAMPGRGWQGPDVSVVVPAYGIEKYLDRCLESLVSQTLDTLEILVVDDGSKDRSGQIADAWARRDARIRVIHQTNAGCAAARSNGLRAATGIFVGLVDGDDWVDPPMYQALAESAVRFTSDIAQCGYRHCYDSNQGWLDEREYHVLSQTLGEGNGLVANPRALIPWRPTIWRRLYRRDFLAGHGIDFPYTLRRFDDLPFHFMTLALAERLSVVSACYYNYRQQRPGQDIAVDDERLYVHFPIFRILKDFVRQHHSRELEEKLFMTQIASHEWASQVIQPRLLSSYRAAARYELFEDRLLLGPLELLWAAVRHSRRHGLWAGRIRMERASGKDAWLAVCDYVG